jgi:hypothetical protein
VCDAAAGVNVALADRPHGASSTAFAMSVSYAA